MIWLWQTCFIWLSESLHLSIVAFSTPTEVNDVLFSSRRVFRPSISTCSSPGDLRKKQLVEDNYNHSRGFLNEFSPLVLVQWFLALQYIFISQCNFLVHRLNIFCISGTFHLFKSSSFSYVCSISFWYVSL